MTDDQFNTLYPQYRPVILAIARKLGGPDDDLVEDLKQEGAIALWSLDLAVVRTNQDAWIRQAVKFKMIDFLRRDSPRRFESLEAHLEANEQLVQLPNGELALVARKLRRRDPVADAGDIEDDGADDE